MTPETIQVLEDAFKLGCPDTEACFSAGIAPSTLYLYCSQNPEFSERKETLKTKTGFMARSIQMALLEDNCHRTAEKVIDRLDGLKVKVVGDINLKVSDWSVESVTAGE